MTDNQAAQNNPSGIWKKNDLLFGKKACALKFAQPSPYTWAQLRGSGFSFQCLNAAPLVFSQSPGVNLFQVDNHTNLDPTDPIPPPPPLETAFASAHPSPAENPVFDLVDVLLITFVAIISLIGCSLLAVLIAIARHPVRQEDIKGLAENVFLLLPAQVVSYILTVGFMAYLLWKKYRARLPDAVLWNLPPPRFILGAFAGGAILGLVAEFFLGMLQRWVPKSLPIEQLFRTPSAAYALAAFGILAAPVAEELFFRGFLYPALARPLGAVPAMVLTAGGFALIHAGQLALAWVPLLLLFTVGMVLTAARARTKSVAVCVLMHMGYNFAQFVLLYIGTDGFRHMERS